MRGLLNSMAGRVFLILFIGTLLSAGFTHFMSERERHQLVGQMRGANAAERISQLVRTLDVLPEGDRKNVLAGASGAGLRIHLGPSATDLDGYETDPALADLLRQRLGTDRPILAARGPCPEDERPSRPALQPGRPNLCRVVSLPLMDGTKATLFLRSPPPPPGPLDGPGAPGWSMLFLICLAALAWLVARIATQPLRDMARAATSLGQDMDRPPLPVAGPTEVRAAAAAFNVMQERIHRHLSERMRMLAAITHDLQTPLTRLRLRLEKVEDGDLRERLWEDLGATQAMIRQGLDLVRNLDGPLPLAPLELSSLLDSLCADAADAGQAVHFTAPSLDKLIVQGNADALRRCLNNLLDNGVKYGHAVTVSLQREEDKAWVRIQDQGPGIPADQLEAVFEPFLRLEGSRSRDSGGTGLGLTIAREIARRHGGRLQLSNLPSGGLEACLELPISSPPPIPR